MILRTRILGLAGILAALFLSLISYTLVSFSNASSQLARVVATNLVVEKTTESLNSTILGIRSDIWDTMVFDLEHRADQIRRLDSQAKGFYQGLRDLADRDPTFLKTAQDLRVLFQGYYQFGSTILELESLDEFVGQALLVQKFRQNQADLLARLSTTLAMSKEQFFGTMDKLNSDFATTTLVAFVLAALVTLTSFFVAFLVAGRLTRPLERLNRTARLVSDGDYAIRPELSSSGEIRELTQTFVEMLDQIQDYSSRMEDLVRARTDALVRTNAIMIKELKLAKTIQDALIPQRFGSRGPLSVAGAYLPMEELGGDFYDVFESSPGVWTIVMADVSGHGVPAALVTAMVKISLGLHSPVANGPAQVLREVNRELVAAIGDLKRYVTMVLCQIDLAAHRLTYCNAGHNELIVVRSSGEVQTYGPNSGVAGLRSDEVYLTDTIPFEPRDTLFLFTDGLIEARGTDRKEFGLGRLLGLVAELSGGGPEALVQNLTSTVLEFTRGQARQDDIAYLSVAHKDEDDPATMALGPFQRPLLESEDPLVHAETLYRNKAFEALIAWIDSQVWEATNLGETSRLYHWQAMAHYHQDNLEAAVASWTRSLTADPDNHRASRNLKLVQRHLRGDQG